MDRRNFIAAMLASATAPAFIPCDRLMRIKTIVCPQDLPLSISLDIPNFTTGTWTRYTIPTLALNEVITGGLGGDLPIYAVESGILTPKDREFLTSWCELEVSHYSDRQRSSGHDSLGK